MTRANLVAMQAALDALRRTEEARLAAALAALRDAEANACALRDRLAALDAAPMPAEAASLLAFDRYHRRLARKERDACARLAPLAAAAEERRLAAARAVAKLDAARALVEAERRGRARAAARRAEEAIALVPRRPGYSSSRLSPSPEPDPRDTSGAGSPGIR